MCLLFMQFSQNRIELYHYHTAFSQSVPRVIIATHKTSKQLGEDHEFIYCFSEHA